MAMMNQDLGRLRRPILTVWLDNKRTGKTYILASSNELAITRIDDRRYCSRIPIDESRIGERPCDIFIQGLQRLEWRYETVPRISASPSEKNRQCFNVMILGPTQSPYEC
ncbi:hypothetical protein CASFOL_033276 [Castilleja foliolosa]|uniref:Uncharacterized protein n=1 Tax=Castilleja foliolosa TaxID=1961234 RepID=A0ABD3C001_9LAMI